MINKLTLIEYIERSISENKIIPSPPTYDELPLIRKGLRKKKVPDIAMLPNQFKYEGVGEFNKDPIGKDCSLLWNTASNISKKSLFSDLCLDPKRELDRLEFGWMIANFARLDCSNHLAKMTPISWADHHQDQFNKQREIQFNHFSKIENAWRHWSIVKAGHMLFC